MAHNKSQCETGQVKSIRLLPFNNVDSCYRWLTMAVVMLMKYVGEVCERKLFCILVKIPTCSSKSAVRLMKCMLVKYFVNEYVWNCMLVIWPTYRKIFTKIFQQHTFKFLSSPTLRLFFMDITTDIYSVRSILTWA